MRRLMLLLPLIAAGCASHVIETPSLSPRAVEKNAVPMPDEASEPQTAADAALLQQIATIEAAANSGHATFAAAQTKAETAIAKAANAPSGSEAWTAAQQELSALDATRGAVGHAAADLDGLRDDPAHFTSGNRAAIDAAAARVEALSKAEADTMDRLAGSLKS